MNEILKIDHVAQYNEWAGCETRHPLVNIIDFTKCPQVQSSRQRRRFGIYAVFLKDVKCGDIQYGRHLYDYQEGTLVFFAPGQIIGVNNGGQYIQPQGWALIFHPDLLRGTPLARAMKKYVFFSYEAHEALHLSEQERKIIVECLNNIQTELQHTADQHSDTLIVTNIELLLNYCLRFYDRQFITRSNVNKDILIRFEALMDEYFQSDNQHANGLPSVQYFAEQLHLSANYFGDLIKKETGKSPQEHIQLKLINTAKERIFDTSKSISEIAYELGFSYPQHFSRFFKKTVGCSPNEYRLNNHAEKSIPPETTVDKYMETKIHKNGIMEIINDNVIIKEVDDILDYFFINECSTIIIKKENILNDFFVLSTGFAGELLQKCSNYNIRLAIIGDYANIESKSLTDFIYESNKTKRIIFVKTIEEAIKIFNG
jgi:AraC-like DNA-binding protein